VLCLTLLGPCKPTQTVFLFLLRNLKSIGLLTRFRMACIDFFTRLAQKCLILPLGCMNFLKIGAKVVMTWCFVFSSAWTVVHCRRSSAAGASQGDASHRTHTQTDVNRRCTQGQHLEACPLQGDCAALVVRTYHSEKIYDRNTWSNRNLCYSQDLKFWRTIIGTHARFLFYCPIYLELPWITPG